MSSNNSGNFSASSNTGKHVSDDKADESQTQFSQSHDNVKKLVVKKQAQEPQATQYFVSKNMPYPTPSESGKP